MSNVARLVRLVGSIIDPRSYVHVLRVINFYNYSHIAPRRQLRAGHDVRISPTVSFREADHISVGDRVHIGEHCLIWAGGTAGTVTLGDDCLLGPHVSIFAADYCFTAGAVTRDQPSRPSDVVIGKNVWLGANVVITAGVEVGDNAVVGAGSVVTRDIPAGSMAAGSPARVVYEIGHRQDDRGKAV